MLKKALGKAVAGTAAAGLVLVPSAASLAPQFATVACDYPDSVATSTDITLDKTAAPYGSTNTATVQVSSGAGTPEGKVKIRVKGVQTWTHTLSNGRASQSLPRTLDAGETYTVRGIYNGQCDWRGSSDSAFYTVKKAGVNVNPFVDNGKKGQFSAVFRGRGGLDPQGGQAKFVVRKLTKNGSKWIAATRTSVSGGAASVDMKNLSRGDYKLKVKFLGTSNFKKGKDSVGFSVGR